MGFGIPAAIGAALSTGEGALCVTGDGSLMMNLQELATVAELGIDLKVVVMDNGALGMVCQQQSLLFGRRHTASGYRASGTSPCALAQAFGIPAVDLGDERDPHRALRRAFAQSGPVLVRAPIDADELVLPMVRPGQSNLESIHKLERCHE